MDILRLLDELHEMTVKRPRSFMGLTWGLDQDEIGMQISKVRASLPQELKVAATTARESDRIIESAKEDAGMTIENARKEAERIVAEAHEEAQRVIEQSRIEQSRLVAESEILRISKTQSEEIRNSAERDALQMRRGAEKYAFDVLTQLEGVVGKAMSTIERGKAEMQKSVDNTPAAAPNPRERVKI